MPKLIQSDHLPTVAGEKVHKSSDNPQKKIIRFAAVICYFH